MIIQRTSNRVAPSARRIPTSFIRCDKEYEATAVDTGKREQKPRCGECQNERHLETEADDGLRTRCDLFPCLVMKVLAPRAATSRRMRLAVRGSARVLTSESHKVNTSGRSPESRGKGESKV